VALASVAIVLALLAGYLRHAVVNSDQFANRATAALRDERVRGPLAERITDELLAQEPNLVAARPLIESIASELVGGRAFTGLIRAAVRDVHRAVFDRDRNTVTLTLADVGTVIAAALEQVRPSLARQLEDTGALEVATGDFDGIAGALPALARDIRVLSVVLPALALALVVAALAVSRERRQTVMELGIGAAAGGVLIVVGYEVAQALLGDVGQALLAAFFADLRTAALILAGAGAVVAGAAASLLRPVDLGVPLARTRRLLAAHPVLRGITFILAGVVLIAARDAVVAFVLTVVGVYLVYEGVTALLRITYRPEERMPLRVPRRALVALVPVVLVGVAVAAFVGSGAVSTAAPSAGGCNGHEELCDRTLTEIAVASTHNSMSVPLPGWYASMQEAPIADQLRDGIHGLLIDTHYADLLPNGRLRTDLTDFENSARSDGVSQEAVDAAMRIRDRLGFTGEGERGMYLCHSFCELGGTTLESVLDDIHAFLVANPGEVLVIINQDYVTPADFVGAVREAGLEPFAYRGSTTVWPTLGEMVESGQRVVFLAENDAGGAPWYHPAYERITQETPFGFSRVPQLVDPAALPASCRPNRGLEGAPVFLLNHWITTDPVPLPSNAAQVNAYKPLLARARECERIRDAFPNLIAVDFYREGDVFGVVDTLNGVD